MRNNGFSLIELMIVVAIISILAALALPAYSNYLVRSRVVEGLKLASMAKDVVYESASNIQSLAIASAFWNAQANGFGATSKYVSSIKLSDDGEVLVVFNTNMGVTAAENLLVLTPYVRSSAGVVSDLVSAIGVGVSGAIDWACTSATKDAAASSGMSSARLGTMRPEYVPAQCR